MKRLQGIESLLSISDKFIDVGCDHAYVCIDMAHQGANHILASDINIHALDRAKENIKKNHLERQIKTALSAGLNDIDTAEYNTLVITGMGAYTILDILANKKKLETIEKMIISSNNDLDILRRGIEKINYQIKKEIIVYENNHYYTIIEYQKGQSKLQEWEYLFGIYQKENAPYYQYLLKHYEEIKHQVPLLNIKKRKELNNNINYLKKYYHVS